MKHNHLTLHQQIHFRIARKVSFFLLAFLPCAVFAQRSTVKEEIVSMKTYPYSDPNPLPAMVISNKVSPFYPYNTFDGYTDKGIDQKWKVVKMENPYIEVTVLPEVGGKVMGAIEKSSGQEFVYLNHVMKFRSIGIRGPWTSGGIEHNFGLDLGHAPWAAGPVDYLLIENPDGSASCIVGGIDLASRTQWRVNIHLPKDKAYFETRALWYNPTPFHEAYLSWENAAYKATDDLQFFFPGTHHIDHDGSAAPWPTDEQGRDLSWYKNNNFGGAKSYHVMGNVRNWFGGYWHESDFGFGHWAPYADAPGKKLWIWPLSRNGAIWEDLLTDNDGQYIEAQSGVKFNQAAAKSGYHTPFTQLSFRPYYTDTKSDYWFPVKQTKGMVDASPYGTLNVTQSQDGLNIRISPVAVIRDTLKVSAGGRVIHSELVSLLPMQLFERTIPNVSDKEKAVRVSLGQDRLVYTTSNHDYEIDRPVENTIEKKFESAERSYRLGEEQNAMRNYADALKHYQKCIAEEPVHSKALTRLAELNYRKGAYDEGIAYAQRVLEFSTYDGGANFIYGVLQKAKGNLVKAEEAFAVAARTMEYRSAAYLQMASLSLLQRDYESAIDHGRSALEYNRYNLSAYNILSSAYRKSGRSAEAEIISEKVLAIDPLNHYARFEKYLLSGEESGLDDFRSGIRNEFPHETYLELAIEYFNVGLKREATEILELSPSYPTVHYWLAYLSRDHSPERSAEHLRKALASSPEMVFPFRTETIPVFLWAQEKQASWKNLYYLGLIYWNKTDTGKAKELFAQCGEQPDYAPFYLTRHFLFDGDTVKGNRDLEMAVRYGAKKWRVWHALTEDHFGRRSFREALTNAQKAYKLFPANPVIRMDYAKALLNTGNYKNCLKVLSATTVLPQEGAREGHDIYELANLAEAVALMENGKYKSALQYIEASREWPENLGAGKPYDPDTRLQDFMASICEQNLGNQEKSRTYEREIENYSQNAEHWTAYGEPVNNYIGYLVLSRNNKLTQANALVADWKARLDELRNWDIGPGASSPPVQWVLAKINNDHAAASERAQQLLSGRAVSRFGLFLKVLTSATETGSSK